MQLEEYKKDMFKSLKEINYYSRTIDIKINDKEFMLVKDRSRDVFTLRLKTLYLYYDLLFNTIIYNDIKFKIAEFTGNKIDKFNEKQTE